jgi:hypothetical protein
MMFPLDDLVQVAEELQKHSIDAVYSILYGHRGAVEGLEIGEDFFPLWELNQPENRAALEINDFSTIKARRGPGWSMESPRYARAGG